MPKRKKPIPTQSEPRVEWIDWSHIGTPTRDDSLRQVRFIGKPISFFKYAANAIDRATQSIRIVEGSESLFMHLRRFYEMTGVDPGGPDACDFDLIRATERGKVTYEVKYDINVRTPFNDDEKLLIRTGFFDLTSVFRPMPQDEVEQRLGLPPP